MFTAGMLCAYFEVVPHWGLTNSY